MELLDFARPGVLTVALAIFVLGTLWRLAGAAAAAPMRDLSPRPRGAPPAWLGAAHVLGACGPRPEFAQAVRLHDRHQLRLPPRAGAGCSSWRRTSCSSAISRAALAIAAQHLVYAVGVVTPPRCWQCWRGASRTW